MKITPSVLEQVHYDNVRDHQIGGETDGMSPEVARDLGFLSLHEAIQVSNEIEVQPVRRQPTIAEQKRYAAKHVAEHLKRVNKQVIDPYYG